MLRPLPLVLSVAILCLLALPGPASAGDILAAECPCGFKTRLGVYGGRANFKRQCGFPALCAKAHAIVTFNVFDPSGPNPAAEKLGCSASDLVPYDDPSLAPNPPGEVVSYWRLPGRNQTVSITSGGYVCPRCGKKTLHFRHAGNWD